MDRMHPVPEDGRTVKWQRSCPFRPKNCLRKKQATAALSKPGQCQVQPCVSLVQRPGAMRALAQMRFISLQNGWAQGACP